MNDSDSPRLTALFSDGALLADTDGDSLPDAARARLLLGAGAALPEHLAAANLAARLGFETLALREPLLAIEPDTAPDGRIDIYIGRPATLPARCPAPLRDLAATLAPGEGLVALAQGPGPALLLTGADAAGLATAVHALAADLLPGAVTPTGVSADRATSLQIARIIQDVHGPQSRSADEITIESVEDRLEPTAVGGPTPPGGDPAIRPQSVAPEQALASLADLYGPAGLSLDLDGDLLPEQPRVRVLLPDDLTPADAEPVVELSARIGLETLGLALPLAVGHDEAGAAEAPITIAVAPLDHATTESAPGVGSIRLQATDEGRQIVRVQGSDPAGRTAAIAELARLDAWRAEGAPSLAAIQRSLDRLCAFAEPGAAICAVKSTLQTLAVRAPAAPPEPLRLHVALPETLATEREAVAGCITHWAEEILPGGPRTAQATSARRSIVFDDTRRFTWEVDDLWRYVREEILPALAALPPDDAEWQIDLRIGEPEGRRRQVQHAILEQIRASGRSATSEQVQVLPAYFQGRAWLLETLLPALQRLPVRAIVVRAQRFLPKSPSLELPIRWLQDLFPVDELLADRLDLPVSAIRFEFAEIATTYEVEAHGEDGAVLLRLGFEVTYGRRLYLPGYPDWGHVHPPTGCARLTSNGRLLVDRRIAPDPERVWDYIQDDLLPRLAEHIRVHCGGNPRPDRQPFFGDLIVDVWLSEEDTSLGVREERVSSLESLHEDLYFMLLDYCTALMSGAEGDEPYLPPWVRPPAPGQSRRGARYWTAPGRIIPRMHRRDGAGGMARVRLTEPDEALPALQWTWGTAHGSEPLAGAAAVSLAITGIDVRRHAEAGTQPARTLHLTLEGADDATRQARLLLDGWSDLRQSGAVFDYGIPRDLSFEVWDRAGGHSHIPAAGAGTSTEVFLPRAWDTHEDEHTAQPTAVGGPTPPGGDPAVRPRSEALVGTESMPLDTAHEGGPASGGGTAEEAAYTPGESTVPWDRVLGVEAIEAWLRALGRLPTVLAYEAGRSAQGRPSYAVEITVPRRTGCWSRAKLSSWKCTLQLNARHHANEPSSTSALLRLAELLAHDPEWQRYLVRVNVILTPGENVDGMALYQELQDEHPTWMHHAARYNGAGMEYASEYTNPRTRHTEALVVPALWRRWAPDIFCDDHGFPAHAWVQPFAGHGNPWFRDYWIAQGLIFAYLPCADSPRYPRHPEAAGALQRRMVEALATDPQVAPWNERHADRYVTYLNRWSSEEFPAPYERGALVHRSTYDPDAASTGLSGLPGRFPGVTTASITTEVADETAQGSYMALCAHAHLLLDRVLLQYLYDVNAPASVQRRLQRLPDGRTLLLATRERPAILQS